MAKMYFRYGAMSSSKSLNLLAVAHNYQTYQNKSVFLIKPSVDTRSNEVESRTGLKMKADLILKPTDIDITQHIIKDKRKIYCVLVDESQFLTETQVYELTEVCDKLKIPVICYGLKTDFRNQLFEGSEALIKWCDKVEEIKTVCFKDGCNSKAIHNMRLVGGKPSFEGESIVIGDISEDKQIEYKPVCRKCYKDEMANINKEVELCL